MKMVFSLLEILYFIKTPSYCVSARNNAHFCQLKSHSLQYGVLKQPCKQHSRALTPSEQSLQNTKSFGFTFAIIAAISRAYSIHFK